jgi:hypothetical protein
MVTLIGLCLSIAGCKKFVEIGPPANELVTASVFDNSTAATAAQTVIYSMMNQNDESYLMSQTLGMLSDELTNYSSDAILIQYYQNAMMNTGITYGPWTNAYSYIYKSNAVIAGLQNNNGITPAIRQQLTAEAEFVRAFWHFYLTGLYGDVPVITTTDYTVNESIARSPKAQVFQQIISDLTDAANKLSPNYVDASDTAVTTERVRPTKWAAMALLARAYLYTGKYDSAEMQASAVIANTGMYTLCTDLTKVFLANSTEAIWQLQTPLPTANTATPDGQYFILISAPEPGTTNCNTLSTQLLNSFETGDNRRALWVDSFSTGPAQAYYFPYKYEVSASSSSSPQEYVMVLRLAEQYLIRAEARAQQKNLAGSASDLNVIRNRAGLDNTMAATQTDLLTAILHERQTELFAEWGHRWLDLIRTGNANTVMGVVTPLKEGTWNANWQVMPIPQSERNVDVNLTQNPGY